MFRLSKKLAKLEDRIAGRWGKKLDRFQSRHKGEWKYLIPLGLVAWYFAGMLLNSIRLGIQSVFGADSDQIKSIWVVNPFVNFAAVFTPTGLATIAVGALMFCLITKKGYHWFSGYKYTRDKRGFDILPNGTHGEGRTPTGEHPLPSLGSGRDHAPGSGRKAEKQPKGGPKSHCLCHAGHLQLHQ